MNEQNSNSPYSTPALRKYGCVQSRIGEIDNKSDLERSEIKIIKDVNDFEALEQEWNALAWKSDSHIFQTYEWNRIWWKHFGTNKKLHIVAVYLENKLVGIAPFFEDDVHLFDHKVYSCLRFLGSYVSQPEGEPLTGSISYSDYLGCIIHPEYENLFCRLILQHFKEVKSEFNEIILDEVSEDSAIYHTMIPLMGKSNYELSYQVEQASSSPVIQLDPTWKAYLDSLSVKDRYNARRYFKRSKKGNKKAFKIEKIENTDELSGVLENMIRMHQQQWNSRGFAGTFAEKRMREFFIEIAEVFYENGWIELNTAVPEEADVEYVAVDAILTYKDRVYLMHRGMDKDSLYRKQGPGNVLLYARLNKAINDGMKVFDMLRGEEEFKLRMATKINQNKKNIICFGYKPERLVPRFAKMYLKIIRHIKLEKIQFNIVFSGKSFFKGITEYIQFLHRRIKHKLNT